MILHLDMDAFFAAVEQLDNPELAGRPVIIGHGDRGVVATASYEARVYGARSAMPIAQARKLCPHAVFLPGRFKRYRELSARMMAALRTFSPIAQQASIDEAYLDISGLGRFWRNPLVLARAVKAAVGRATGGLTCSIGVAPVKFLAKICSDINKPDGIYILPPQKVEEFLAPLPVEKIPGVGGKMSASLRSFGVERVGQLRALSREFLAGRYGRHGLVLHDRARGLDPRPVRENPPPKSESAECTFERDVWDRERLAEALRAHSLRVSASLKKHGLAGRSITVRIKFDNFERMSRQRTLEWRTDDAAVILGTALEILESMSLRRPARLVGLRVAAFESRDEQYHLPGLAWKGSLARARRHREE